MHEPMEELLNNVDVTDVVTSVAEFGETKGQKPPLNAQKHHETTKVSMEDPTRSAKRRNISTQWMSLMKLPQQSAAEIGKPKRLKSPLNAEKQHETNFSMEDPTRSASTSLRPRPTESLPKKPTATSVPSGSTSSKGSTQVSSLEAKAKINNNPGSEF